MQKIGVISDTHGLLREGAVSALNGVDLIIHAGDLGGAEILERLASIAPVHAVRGNCDYGTWALNLPADLVVETGGGLFYALHDLMRLNLDLRTAGIKAVIFGHTHVPEVYWQDDVLFLNPGSAGPVRSGRPASMSIVQIDDNGEIYPDLVRL